jgi:ribonuclease P protein component
MNATLPARFRPHEHLRDPGAFKRAFAARKSASDDGMIVYAVRNELAHTRLGISIGKKKVKSAAGRNRIKRLLREAFRLNKAAIPLGVDLVIVPRGPTLNFSQAMASLPHLARSASRRLVPRPPMPSP